jgi:hypothetical protein
MTKFFALLLSTLVLTELIAPKAQAAGLPVVISATVDYTHNTVTISGQNFGSSPTVTLDSMTFPTMTTGAKQIVADFPNTSSPSSFTPGTYFLTVTFRNQFPTIFAVDIGANGPPGPQGVAGPAGPQGLQGIQGLTGAAGTPGSIGPTGPMGPAGAAGVMGATGPQGAPGPQGLPGVAGAPGATGPAGAPGSGLPATCASGDVIVFYGGAWTCKSSLPRFVANGDGTVTDNQTGLMWEVTTATCSGEATCYSNTYTWTAGLPNIYPNGSLFTTFIGQLNGGDYYDPTIQGLFMGLIVNPRGLYCDPNGGCSAPCLANHCDWRVPTFAELQSIYVLNQVCGSLPGYPCINPLFGPTPDSIYWSSSTLSTNFLTNFPVAYDEAWCVNFSGGDCYDYKTTPHYARAVRTTR